MNINATCQDLLVECEKRGIEVKGPSNRKRDLLRLLTFDTLKKSPTPPSRGLIRRLTIESPMLCFDFPKLSSDQKRDVLRGENWIVEPKYYGCRVIICYHPEEGFTFWSRAYDENTFIPLEYTKKLLIPYKGQITHPEDWKGKFPESFMLDGIMHSSAGVPRKLEDKYLGFELNYVSLILGLEAEEAVKYQLSHSPFIFSVFDVLYVGSEVLSTKALRTRKKALEALFQAGIPFSEVPYQINGKLSFYRDLVDQGMEGVVFKNLDSPYEATIRRRRDVMVRLKQRMIQTGRDNIDAFVVGSMAPPSGSPGCAYVDSLRLAVYLVDENGLEQQHVIAVARDLPFFVRTEATQEAPFNPHDFSPILKHEYVGRVLTFSGSGLDPKRLFFKHVKVDWARGFRTDKNRFDCVMPKNDLIVGVV